MEDLKAASVGWLEGVILKRIMVHLKDDNSIEGSLVAVMADGLILRAAELRNLNNPPVKMAGEVFVPRENLAFAQLDE